MCRNDGEGDAVSCVLILSAFVLVIWGLVVEIDEINTKLEKETVVRK